MNKQEIEKAINFFNDTLKINAVLGRRNGKEEFIKRTQDSFDIAIECMQQQLNNGWIPVSSSKMPEFDQECLVTVDTGEIFTSKFYGYGEERQGVREYPDGVWEINQCELDVIAWQPLPKPYKEEPTC